MKMRLNNVKLITERQVRAWSQTQLSVVSGLSLRTVQRIEKSGQASLESAKALASVYDLKISDLHTLSDDKSNASENLLATLEEFCFLSSVAKTIAITVFILSTLVLLFLLWTNIPPKWINELRNAVFSAQLSNATLNAISTSFVIAATSIVAILVGLLFDAIRNQGFYHFLKRYIQSDKLSIHQSITRIQQVLINFGRLLFKPLLASATVIIFSGVLLYLTMEDYQKNNMSRFLQNRVSNSSSSE